MSSLVEQLFERVGVECRRARTNRNEITVCCPFCRDDRFRLGINTSRGLGHCYNCGKAWRSPVRMLHELSDIYGVPFDARLLLDVPDEAGEKEEKEKKAAPTGLVDGYEVLSLADKDTIARKAIRYMRSRRFGPDVWEAHGIGYAAAGSMSWRIIFPVFGRNRVVYGCVGRDFSGAQKPKYLNTPGIKLLWNGETQGEVAVLTEGIFDGLRVEQSAPKKIASVVKLGSSLTQLQIKQLKKYSSVVVFPDFDEPGITGGIETCRECVSAGIDTWVVVPPSLDDRDPGAMEEAEIRSYIQAAKQWDAKAELWLKSVRRTTYL